MARLFILCKVIMSLLLVSILSGCANRSPVTSDTPATISVPSSAVPSSGTNEYKTFANQEGIAHFSFEYPNQWELKYSVENSKMSITKFVTVGGARIPSIFIWIQTKTPDVDSPNSSVDMRRALEKWQKNGDIEVLGQSTVQISGFEATQIESNNRIVSYSIPRVDPQRLATTSKFIYFDANGLIWEISSWVLQDNVQTEIKYFEHLIETFKILD
jgi:hypothetical protein